MQALLGGCCRTTCRPGKSGLPAETQRWLAARVFEAMVQDPRALLRALEGRDQQPTAAILDSRRTLRSTPESGGHRAGYDGAKRKRGSKVHAAVDALGHLLALHVTPQPASRTESRLRRWLRPFRRW